MAPSLPARIGPYEITGVLGQGGMGVVYRGRHAQLGVERAVKVMLRGDARALARFEREVAHLARVRHPHVVSIHEAGVHQGMPFFAMELVEGEPLDAVLKRGRPPLRAALTLAAGICRGVDALHAIEVVHRDLKPQNVLVTRDGRPVVVDLGLALAPEQDDRMTRTGAMVGTIGYMAPEQLAGGKDLSPRTDVYALGLILFELVTGQPAVGHATTAAEVIATIIRSDRPLPGDVDPGLPGRLDQVCARATARDAAARYARAGELADAIEDVRRAPGPARRRVRARRRRALAALGLAAAAVVGAAAALRTTREAAPPPAPASGDGAARALAGLSDPAEVVARADAWLAEHPEHPERARVEARRRDARRRLGDAALKALRADGRDAPLAETIAWLAAFPDHPEAGRVGAGARAAARRGPVARLEPADRARFVPGSGGRLAVLLRRADPGLTLWDVERGEAVRRWEQLAGLDLALSPDGAAAYLLVSYGVLRAPLDGSPSSILVTSGVNLRAMALSVDGEVLAVGDGAGGVRLHAADTGAQLRALPTLTTPVNALAFTRGGRLLVGNWGMLAESRGPMVRLVDPADGAVLHEWPLVGSAKVIVPSPDDRIAAVGTGLGRLFVLDLDGERGARVLPGAGRREDQASIAEPRSSDGELAGLVFSPDGRRLTTTSNLHGVGELSLWDLAAGREVSARSLLARPVEGFDLDAADDPRGLGRRLLLAAGDAPAELWLWDEEAEDLR
ncbi:MAG: WD40 repeat domain-containing serine/threonine protein kinase [Planctomycetes bacterium]|nr:WD40 repeat domain-containing serine/threonine protein kinase [Planctomycetota bacterium]